MRTKRTKYNAARVLAGLGFSAKDAESLLRVSNRLHRWHELECGTSRGAISRDEETGKLRWYDNHGWRDYDGPDYETLATNKLKEIMARYPRMTAFVQGDPRGCALYILRPGDVPEGENADAYYSRGIAVYREH